MSYARLAYDPWDTPREERDATFVGRAALLEEILSAVREQRGHRTVQHYLLLGPRGIGKTTILLAIRDRVREDPALCRDWFCVQLREEEYFVRTLRDLLDLTLQALSQDENLPEAEGLAKRVHAEPDEERSLAVAKDGLRSLSRKHGKRILLLIDNFDQIFPRTATGRGKKRSPENEYRAFRKMLSTESFLMVIGASVRLFEEIAQYDQAFFNFFCPIDIASLSDDEICELLRRRAVLDGDRTFTRKLESVRDKVRAITYMTGGNPRLVLMLYDVLRQREMLPVVQALRETVGGLTPMLKRVLDDMPRQQSKTLDGLVRLGGVASPAEIAEQSRLPLNVVTAQLGRLKEGRFVTVEGEGKGRPAAYRVADPMFRTWYQMRYLRPAGRRIELFVEFLRAWFSVEDRRRFIEERWERLQKRVAGGAQSRVADACVGIEYYAASLEDEAERRLHFYRLADTMFESGRALEAARLMAELEAPAGASPTRRDSLGYLALADRLVEKGSTEKAIEVYREALRKNPKNVVARMGLGVSLGVSGDHAGALVEFEGVASTPELSNEVLSRALYNRGVSKGALGDAQGAIADYTAVAELTGAPVDQVVWALYNRGVRKGALGDAQGEIADYTAVVELPGAPVDQVAWALYNRGVSKRELGDAEGAIADYTAVVELPGAPVDQVAKALTNRGVSKRKLGDAEGAIADYTAVVELPGAPVDQVAMALTNRGGTHGASGDHESALRDFKKALVVTGVSKAIHNLTILNKASALVKLDRTYEAISDLAECVESGADAAIVCQAVTRLVLLNLQENRREEAMNWASRLSQLEPSDAELEHRLEARIDIVTDAGRGASLEAAESLLEVFLKSDPPDIRQRIAFLGPAIAFARTGDERMLASLPQEERRLAKEIAGTLGRKADDVKHEQAP